MGNSNGVAVLNTLPLMGFPQQDNSLD
jgi:hypothetical protein